jgi:hypothetical protein
MQRIRLFNHPKGTPGLDHFDRLFSSLIPRCLFVLFFVLPLRLCPLVYNEDTDWLARYTAFGLTFGFYPSS